MAVRLISRVALCVALSCLWGGAFVASAAAGDDPPADRQKLARDMETQYRGGNYQKAYELCEKLHALEPSEPSHLYNLACLKCLMGDKSAAYEWLEKAVDAGYKDAEHLSSDPDFRTIRGEDRFRALLRRVRDGNDRAAKRETSETDEKKNTTRAATKEKPEPEAARSAKKRGARIASDEEKDDEEVSARVQALSRQMGEAVKAKEYEKALKFALRARKLADIGVTNYNVACMYALLEKKDEAFQYLEAAVRKKDFPADLAKQMENDDDLDALRDDPRYARLLKLAKGENKPEPDAPKDKKKKVKFEWKVTLPAQPVGGKAPLLVVLHGARGNMNESAQTWKDAANEVGAILLTPQGTYQSGRNAFEWGDDLDAVEENILDAIEQVTADHPVDKRRVLLAGVKQSSATAWTIGVRHPELFHGLFIMCVKCEPMPTAALDDPEVKNLRVVVLCGDEKKKSTPSCREAIEKLQKKGAAVQFKSREESRREAGASGVDEQVQYLKYLLEQ